MNIKLNSKCYEIGSRLIFSNNVNGDVEVTGDAIDIVKQTTRLANGITPINFIADENAYSEENLLEVLEPLFEKEYFTFAEQSKKGAFVSKDISLDVIQGLCEHDELPHLLTACSLEDIKNCSVDFVVGMGLDKDFQFFDEVNKQAQILKIPWIRVAISNHKVFLGPIFFPKDGPCYKCFQTRMSTNMSENEEITRIYDIGRVETIATALIKIEILKFLDDKKFCNLFEQENIMNLHTLTIEKYKVFKMPGCDFCANR